MSVAIQQWVPGFVWILTCSKGGLDKPFAPFEFADEIALEHEAGCPPADPFQGQEWMEPL